MTEFDKIKLDIRDFNARIKSWDLDQLSEDQADEIADELEETMALLAGEGEAGEESDEDEDDVE